MEFKHSQPWHVAYPKYEERMRVISKAVQIYLDNPELIDWKLAAKN